MLGFALLDKGLLLIIDKREHGITGMTVSSFLSDRNDSLMKKG
jgi:hypothetical protein